MSYNKHEVTLVMIVVIAGEYVAILSDHQWKVMIRSSAMLASNFYSLLSEDNELSKSYRQIRTPQK